MSIIAGIVLAGGLSSRMGKDKSLLTLPQNNETLINHARRTLSVLCGDFVYVSGSQHDNAIADIAANCGPMSGLHAALHFFRNNQVSVTELVFMPVDMPSLRVEDLSLLIEKGRINQRMACYASSYMPLYMPNTSQISDYLDQQMSPKAEENNNKQTKKQRYSIKNMLKAMHGVELPPMNDTRLDNINTPQQWQNYQREVNQQGQ